MVNGFEPTRRISGRDYMYGRPKTASRAASPKHPSAKYGDRCTFDYNGAATRYCLVEGIKDPKSARWVRKPKAGSKTIYKKCQGRDGLGWTLDRCHGPKKPKAKPKSKAKAKPKKGKKAAPRKKKCSPVPCTPVPCAQPYNMFNPYSPQQQPFAGGYY
jgi:hypothetical protein